ncbi:hypothetical protein [Streptomyces ochraceiscleroticus]|uniref:Uncharacterized protein n=1 Tax=Streptomyces ochraceiscleroticus TaxID=47761 RepID=A0ABW1MN83_9ACTN|nr:hypothetical protein [Streptomyces ochraceiscleroticus]
MSLSSHLADKHSPLRKFLTDELPNVSALRAAYRQARPTAPVILPQQTDGTRPPWHTIGAAIDHRIRLSLQATVLRNRSVGYGIQLAGRYSPTLYNTGTALLDELQHQATIQQLDDRTRPVHRTQQTEDHLARLCYAAALFEEVYRSGRLWPSTPLAHNPNSLTLQKLLNAVPDNAATDLALLTTRADTGLAEVRRRTQPTDIVLAPTFTGSTDADGADADWIAKDLLIDVKATKDPDALPAVTVYQLVGYLLLDYKDNYRINEAGWYHARTGTLVSWPLNTFLTLLNARRSLSQLRSLTQALLISSGTPPEQTETT